MKLLFCAKCGDIQALIYDIRWCICGETAARYMLNGLIAQISGPGGVLAMSNSAVTKIRECVKNGTWDNAYREFWQIDEERSDCQVVRYGSHEELKQAMEEDRVEIPPDI